MFVDFFDLNTKKIVVQSCYNMTKYIRNIQTFRNCIEPGIQQLTSLTKYTGNTEIEKQILNQSILCFYNIFYSIKVYKLFLSDDKIWEKVNQYGVFDNLTQILEIFLRMIRGKNLVGDSSHDHSKTNIGSYMEIFKSVMKVLQIVSEGSITISNNLLNGSMMELIYSFLKEELDFSSNENSSESHNDIDRSKSNISGHHIFHEIFPFLYLFFQKQEKTNIISNPNDNFNPSTEEKAIRLIIDNKSDVYKFFSTKIIPLIVNNFVSISSSHISIKVLKLINIYIFHSSGENLKTYLDSWKLANILSSIFYKFNKM
jgi:hypothetical protein